MANFIIIDKTDKLYEYDDSEGGKTGLDAALLAHVRWLRGVAVPARFNVSDLTWLTFNNALQNTEDKIKLFNGLCTREKYGIKRIITGYSDTYNET